MAKLNIKRAPRIEVPLSTGDVIAIRGISAVDVSDLVKMFDMETVELTAKIINHVQAGQPIGDLLINPELWSDLVSVLPDLCARAITLVSGGDEEDYEAIRELGVEDFALLTAGMVSHSLQRIGGLGNLIDLATKAAKEMNDSLQIEIERQKGKGIASSSPSGGKSRSSRKQATPKPKNTP